LTMTMAATTRKTTPPLPTTSANMRHRSTTCTYMLCSLIVIGIACVETGSAFLLTRQTSSHHRNRQKQMGFLIHTYKGSNNIQKNRIRLAESAATSDETAPGAETDDIGSMRVSEIKKELVRLNVSSKDCFDRESLVERLLEARQRPKSQSSQESPQPEQSTRSEAESSTTATATKSTDETKAAATAGTSTPTPTAKKDTQSKEEIQEEVSTLSVKELRTELAVSGIRWAGMLEKRDLVDAVVKCRQETAGFSVTGKMRPSKVTDLTADELTQELTSTDTLVLLDVYATW
jgi:hypothetical protein